MYGEWGDEHKRENAGERMAQDKGDFMHAAVPRRETTRQFFTDYFA